jgi:hypothetical protein
MQKRTVSGAANPSFERGGFSGSSSSASAHIA